MHVRSQSWFGTDLSIKRGGVKLILLDTTSPFTKMYTFYMLARPLKGVVSRGGAPVPFTLGGPKANR